MLLSKQYNTLPDLCISLPYVIYAMCAYVYVLSQINSKNMNIFFLNKLNKYFTTYFTGFKMSNKKYGHKYYNMKKNNKYMYFTKRNT